jgi:hypothetical protein
MKGISIFLIIGLVLASAFAAAQMMGYGRIGMDRWRTWRK